MPLTARRFVINLTMLSAGDLIAKVLLFFAYAHLARALGTGLFGDIAFASAFALYFTLLAGQGLDVYAVQETARDHGLIRKTAANMMGLRLVTSLVALAALWLVVAQLPVPPHVKKLLLLYGAGALPAALSLQWVFQAVEQMKLVALSHILGQAVFAGSVLLVVRNPEQLLWVPVLQVAGEALSAVFLLACYIGQFRSLPLLLQPSSWWPMLKQSVPIGLSGTLGLVLANFDLVLLGFLKPAAEVGEYGAAGKVTAFFSSLVLMYSRNLFPAVARARNTPVDLKRISEATQKYVLLLSVPLAVGGTLLAHPLMQRIYGPDFTRGAGALAILIWIIPIMCARILYRSVLLSHGLQKQNLWASLAAVGTNLALNFALIPRYSYMGSAVAWVAAEGLLLWATRRLVCRGVEPLRLWPHAWPPAVTSLPMAGLLLISHAYPLPARIAAGFVLYVGSGLAFRTIDVRDIRAKLFPKQAANTRHS